MGNAISEKIVSILHKSCGSFTALVFAVLLWTKTWKFHWEAELILTVMTPSEYWL